MNKSFVRRHKAIQEILQKELVSDQSQLVELLRKHYYIETNQAVVSRDLHKLGVVKKQVNGVFVYELPLSDIHAEILQLAIIDVCHNESLIVIRTQPALAAFVGDAIDQLEGLDILGCLAGENVVFVTPQSTQSIKKTYESLCQKIGFKKRHV